MKRTALKRMGWIVMVLLLLAGCSAPQAEEPAAPVLSESERLEAAMENLENATSMTQVVDFNVGITFDESMSSEENEFVVQLMAMLSSIDMHFELALENYQFGNLVDNPDLKGQGLVSITAGETVQSVTMYVADGKTYVSDGINPLYYVENNMEDALLQQDQMNLEWYLLNGLESDDYETTAETIDGVAVTRYRIKDSEAIIRKILSEDETLSGLVGSGSEAWNGFGFESMEYYIDVNEANQIAHIGIGFNMNVPEDLPLLGVESIHYLIDIRVDDINETTVDLPDLSDAIAQPAVS